MIRPMPDAAMVQQMFARVADRYDRANKVLSLGTDRRWRNAVAAVAGLSAGERVLDVCAGTGDLTLALARRGAAAVGADFCAPMLVHARRKGAAVDAASRPRAWLAADALALPFDDASFDLATVAFGIRNVADPVAGLREMARVVRPGGRVVVLEFCKPRVPLLRTIYFCYFRHVLPRLGRWITSDKGGAYSYLPASVMGFPEREAFLDLMRQAGLVQPRARYLSLGIAAVYRAERTTG
ncbi:MAG: bifunctional demethylmenaquinone methyltransferase/2-methoxy-6-polyprenyl-1,4-benzoquinol methylase UbiE [Planctomycetes bacterium]|nr:bifunctional demethylmenaquinone methyltransferase/2-methoxy-6-polyprenyl-1,4-benzoquinol methylase UbiE [Planctomycetota bacterium]